MRIFPARKLSLEYNWRYSPSSGWFSKTFDLISKKSKINQISAKIMRQKFLKILSEKPQKQNYWFSKFKSRTIHHNDRVRILNKYPIGGYEIIIPSDHDQNHYKGCCVAWNMESWKAIILVGKNQSQLEIKKQLEIFTSYCSWYF